MLIQENIDSVHLLTSFLRLGEECLFLLSFPLYHLESVVISCIYGT